MTNKNILHINKLFKLLKISNREELKEVARTLKIKYKELEFYNNNKIYPQGDILKKILIHLGCTEFELKLRLGIIDYNVQDWISENPEYILKNYKKNTKVISRLDPKFSTDYGKLYRGDCIKLMKSMQDSSVDLIFADPPFNLDKQYESGINDKISEDEYIKWTEAWLLECIRILKPGGSIFVYNIPYWNTYTSNILNKYLNFRHWIAISLKGLMPVSGKLYPSHYSLLYYVKGEKPSVFNKEKIPMATCRHCGGEIHDYGGKKKSLDPSGLSISDVWTDINPVRHKKFKNREANELPLKLLHRVINIASNEGDVVFDPFGGSGTTYVVSEYLKRKWIGIEIGNLDDIINRFNENKLDIELLKKIDSESNVLFTKDQVKIRANNSFWGYEILDKIQIGNGIKNTK